MYVTPELKKKKKFYKINFMISIFVIIALISIYIYAEYDKAKNEELSQDILTEMEVAEDEASEEEEPEEESGVWQILADSVERMENERVESITEEEDHNSYTASNGRTYDTVGRIKIPSIDVNYPILAETTDKLLKISPCKFYGPSPNEVGNLCIAGHNYKNKKFFSKVPNLVTGDVIKITDTTGRTLKYSVYDKYVVVPEDTSCTSQLTNGKKIVTLITCTNDNEKRVIVKAKEIE